MPISSHITIAPAILVKLNQKHGVTQREVEPCFDNRAGGFLEDAREDHKTDPVTRWFIGETNKGRELKVCFVIAAGAVHVKTAYEPNQDEVRIYNKYAFN